MSLNEPQKHLVYQTFASIVDAEAFASTFYHRLFDLRPDYRPMFKGDITEQGKKLMSTIRLAIVSLDNLESVVPALQTLGKRHATYGVQPEDYGVVGEALLWTLEKTLVKDFTPEVQAAWAGVYTVLAETAIAGNYPNRAL